MRISSRVLINALILLLAAIIGLIAGLALQRDPGVDAASFQSGIREVFQRNNLVTAAEGQCSPEQVPLPLAIRWHPRRWHRTPDVTMSPGPGGDAAECYLVMQEDAPSFECYVRYLGGRAVFVEVRARPDLEPVAGALRAGLAEQFPQLPVKLTLR